MPGRSARNYTSADKALFWSRSGGICCFPDCKVLCVQEATCGNPSVVIGDIAHIEAKSDAGPRANPSISDRERDAYPNLILLCPTHHRLVDSLSSTYTANILRGWKANRERQFREALAEWMANITFAELETVTMALMNNGEPVGDSMSLIPPREKMSRNGLSTQTSLLFNIGLVQSKQVEQFVEDIHSLDNSFVGRLISGFVNEYQRRRREGLEGDALFEAMRLFSAQGRSEIQYQCAGLAILVYLFERCEVFER